MTTFVEYFLFMLFENTKLKSNILWGASCVPSPRPPGIEITERALASPVLARHLAQLTTIEASE